MKQYADYHIHTELCGHASGSAEEYVLAALAAGLPEIGFSEHIPMYWLPPSERDPEIAMPEEAWEGYVRAVLDLRARFPEIVIRLGVEADYIPGKEARMAELLAPYPWDYVYGSVHYLGNWGFDNPAQKGRYAEWDLARLYERYFALIVAAARTSLFDVIGHLDVIKKWGHRPAAAPLALYESVAREMATAGVVVEANTGGYRKPVGELYPGPELLAALVRHRVPFTLGSDAHAPAEVGADFGRAADELRDAGAGALIRFERRERRSVPIDG